MYMVEHVKFDVTNEIFSLKAIIMALRFPMLKRLEIRGMEPVVGELGRLVLKPEVRIAGSLLWSWLSSTRSVCMPLLGPCLWHVPHQ